MDSVALERDPETASAQKPDGPREPRRLPWILHCAVRTVTFFVIAATSVWKALRRLTRLDVVMVAIGSFALGMTFLATQPPPEVLYSDFVALVDSGAVRSAQFEEDSDRIYITLRPEALEHLVSERAPQASAGPFQRGEPGPKRGRATQGAPPATSAGIDKLGGLARRPVKLMVRNIPGNVALATHLKSAGVRFGVVGTSLQRSLLRAVGYLTVLWVPLLPVFWFLRRSMYGRDARKKDKAAETSSPKVTFANVAGLGGAKEELLEVVRLLKSPGNYAKLNVKTPSGVLLCGPTGTGKTLLARAVAGEADVPFFAASASEFVEMFVGRGAARIRELFKDARKNVPCVVFVDEIDAVGGRRGYSQNDERDQTLNQLLVELDGFEGNPGIVLLAATNRPEILDPALLRPGRLTRKILVPLPDLEGRCAILGVHLRNVPMNSDEEKRLACEAIARVTNGFSGADLANAVNEAALMAARESKDCVEFKDLMQGVRRTAEPVNAKQSAKGLGKLWQTGNQWFADQWGDAVLEAQKDLRPQPGGDFV